MSNRSFTGARAFMYLGGVQVAWATGVSVQESIGQAPIKILGDVHTQMHETVDVTIGGSFDYFHILQRPMTMVKRSGDVSMWPSGWTAQTSSEASDKYVEFPDMDMLMQDKISGLPVLRVYGVKPQSRSWTITTGGLATWSCSFVATRMEELPVVLPPSGYFAL
jgi:hypothetical protein